MLVGDRLQRDHPDVVDALRALVGTIDVDDMRRMNQAVDDEGRSPASVAAVFLAAQPESGGG